MTARCYLCHEEAGNRYAGPYSAYCDRCQPRDSRPLLKGSQCQCGACGRTLATVTDFDAHLPGTCLDPASIGLELAGDAWGTPEGNAKRAADRARITARNVARATASPRPAGASGPTVGRAGAASEAVAR